jgi:GNAT superfamily N-acetyltransferase
VTEEVTTYHLHMNDANDLVSRAEPAGMTVVRQTPPSPQINHAFFMEVGTPYRWYSRLGWSVSDWADYTNDPDVGTWIGMMDGCPFGYFELQRRNAGEGTPGSTVVETEIMFFGILAAYQGRGLGSALLAAAIREAWALPGTGRVYVHTCTSDHPAALGNYIARGFTVVHEETETETIPDPDDPVWSSPAYYRSLRDRAPS